MNYADALPYVGHYIDDALSTEPFTPDARTVLVGWQCGFEPMFVACRSYLPDVTLDADDAVELATDSLKEKEWFAGEPKEPDYVLTPAAPKTGYKASFLWPHEPDSVEEAGYEFANASTEGFREEWWAVLVARIKAGDRGSHDSQAPLHAHAFARQLLELPDHRIVLPTPVFDSPGHSTACTPVAQEGEVEGTPVILLAPQT